MTNKQRNAAFIDGANLHKGISGLGWKLDYKRFRIWLREKHGVQQAFLFIGLIPKYKDLYTSLQAAGYILVFKETTYDGSGKPKGNCDADLVVHAMRLAFENGYERAIIVSSDGDYASLISFLSEQSKLHCLLSPGKKCSILLRRLNIPTTYLNDVRVHIEYHSK